MAWRFKKAYIALAIRALLLMVIFRGARWK